MSKQGPPTPLSSRHLALAMIASLVLAALALTVYILPANYGIDPTGAGSALGITVDPTQDEDDGTTIERTLLIAPNRTLEQTHAAPAGANLSITWESTTPLNTSLDAVDGNGTRHEVNASWAQNETNGSTTFTAPITGEYRITFHNPGNVNAEIELRITTIEPS